MSRSRYQSSNKELGEMYEHELDQTAQELDATIDELIGESNALMSTNGTLRDTLNALREVVHEDDDCWQDWEPGDLQRLAAAIHAILYPGSTAL